MAFPSVAAVAILLIFPSFAATPLAQGVGNDAPAPAPIVSSDEKKSSAPLAVPPPHTATDKAAARLEEARKLMKRDPPRIARSEHYMMMTDSDDQEVCRSVLTLVETHRKVVDEFFADKLDLITPKERGWVLIFRDEFAFHSFVKSKSRVATAVPELGGLALSPATFTEPEAAMQTLLLATYTHLVLDRLLGK